MTFRNRLAAAISTLSVLALAQIARGETTREQPTTASETTHVEADLSLSGTEHGLAGNGTIRIRQPLVQHMIEKALRGNERLADPRVEHVLADDVYVVSGNVNIVGPDLPVVIRIRLESEDGRLSLSFQDIEGFGPNEWYERSIIEGFAFALRSQGMHCDGLVGKRRIAIGVNDFLHGGGMLPTLAEFDERSTHLGLAPALRVTSPSSFNRPIEALASPQQARRMSPFSSTRRACARCSAGLSHRTSG